MITKERLNELPRVQLESMARERNIVNAAELSDQGLRDAIYQWDRI